MAVRRVVTEIVEGRSRIAEDGPAPSHDFWDDIWVSSPTAALGTPAVEADFSLEPPPGSARWRMFSVPTSAYMRAAVNQDATSDVVAEVDKAGFHQTETVDLVFVLDGDVTLVLDDGEVLLHPGDCVVQQRTNHAWMNENDYPIRLLALMIGLPDEGPG